MSLYLGGLIIGRIFAFEGLFFGGLIYLFFFWRGGGGGFDALVNATTKNTNNDS